MRSRSAPEQDWKVELHGIKKESEVGESIIASVQINLAYTIEYDTTYEPSSDNRKLLASTKSALRHLMRYI